MNQSTFVILNFIFPQEVDIQYSYYETVSTVQVIFGQPCL